MIDFWNLFTHALWIAGAAIVLATWSCADWRAAAQRGGIRDTFSAALNNPGTSFGLMLVCLGAGLGVAGWWERLLWLLLAAALLVGGGWTFLRRRKGSAA